MSSGLSGAFLGTPRRLGRERLTRRDRDSPGVAPTLCCSVQIPTRSSCLAVTMPLQLVPCICKSTNLSLAIESRPLYSLFEISYMRRRSDGGATASSLPRTDVTHRTCQHLHIWILVRRCRVPCRDGPGQARARADRGRFLNCKQQGVNKLIRSLAFGTWRNTFMGRTSRCVHGRSESVMPRTVAAAHTQCAMEHVIHDVISTRARPPRVHTRPCWARLTSLTSTTCMPCYVLSLAPSPPHPLTPSLPFCHPLTPSLPFCRHAERDAAHFSQLGE